MTALTTTGARVLALREAAAGDEGAFARIVAGHQHDMVRVAFGICGDSDLARDAVQAALIVAWRKLGTVREPDSLGSRLVAVVANEARHLVRRRHPGRVAELALDPPGADPADSPAAIRRVDLVNALRRLSPGERTLIALRYGAELDSVEIGRRLGISASGPGRATPSRNAGTAARRWHGPAGDGSSESDC